MRIVWTVLFLGLSVLTGWLAFTSAEPAWRPVADVLFLTCVACFLGAAIAAAVHRLHRTL